VAATLTQIGTTLGAAGRDVDIVDPRTGEARREHVTLDVVLSALQPLTYAPELATLLPEMLTLATRGDFGPLLAANPLLSTNIPEQINTALHFSVTCAEDAPRITPAMEERALAGLLTQHLARQLIAVCEVWPRGTVAAGFTEPVRSDKPVLLISGGMDPVTPPAYGTEVAKGLSNSKHIVAPGYGHIVTPQACGPRLIAAFVDNAGFARLPETCVTHFERSVPPPPWSNRLTP
jgi:pimeloyl-ACP methyl ester carboxylesterase